MHFNQDISNSHFYIRSYQDNAIQILVPNDNPAPTDQSHFGSKNQSSVETLQQSFILTPTNLARDWQPRHPDELNTDHISQILAFQPEVIILGTGRRLVFPNQAITADVVSRGIGIEMMDNSAACRTYNLLMLEGRKIAAAFMLGADLEN